MGLHKRNAIKKEYRNYTTTLSREIVGAKWCVIDSDFIMTTVVDVIEKQAASDEKLPLKHVNFEAAQLFFNDDAALLD